MSVRKTLCYDSVYTNSVLSVVDEINTMKGTYSVRSENIICHSMLIRIVCANKKELWKTCVQRRSCSLYIMCFYYDGCSTYNI